MTGTLLACMGGFCSMREHCANYHAGRPHLVPDERICEPGRDGMSNWAVVIPLQTMADVLPAEHTTVEQCP